MNQKNKAQNEPWNVNIDDEKLSEGLGRCPKNLQGTSPLPQIPRREQEKGAVAPFLLE